MKTNAELQAEVKAAAKVRRAQVLSMRRAGKTLSEVAQAMGGISSQRVSIMEKQALQDEADVSRGTGSPG